MRLTKPLLHVTWEGMIAATQPMCAAQEYPTQAISLGQNFLSRATTMATNNLNGSGGAYLELASSLFGLGTPIHMATPPVDLEKGPAYGGLWCFSFVQSNEVTRSMCIDFFPVLVSLTV